MMKGMEHWQCACGRQFTGAVVTFTPADPETGVGERTDLLATTAEHPGGCCSIGRNGGRPRADLERAARDLLTAYRSDLLAATWRQRCPIGGLTLEGGLEIAEIVCRLAGQYLEANDPRAHRTAKQFVYVAEDLAYGMNLFATAEDAEADLAGAPAIGRGGR